MLTEKYPSLGAGQEGPPAGRGTLMDIVAGGRSTGLLHLAGASLAKQGAQGEVGSSAEGVKPW